MSEYTPPPSAGGGGVGGSGNVIIQDIAQNVQFDGIIWASGVTYYGKNAKTNIVVSSGLEPSHVISTTIAEVGSGSAGQQINVLIKAGDYFLTSGVSISGSNLTLVGEGPEKTNLFADAITSKISGLFILTGHNQEIGNLEISTVSGVYAAIAANGRAHLNMHNLMLFCPGETISGNFGIKLNNSSSSFIKNIEVYSANDGIHLLNCQAVHVEDIYSESFGTLVKLIGSSTRDNTVEFVDATATSYLSGVVGIISGADNNMVHSIHSNFEMPCVYLDTVSGTRQNRISDIANTDISGITILNNSPGVNYIAAYYPDVGISDVPRFTIWVSGSLYQAIRNLDGVMIASGTNAANVFQTVMDTVGVGSPRGGLVHAKAGAYSFTSGWRIGGQVTLFGDPGSPTEFSFDSASGAISGAIRVSGVRAAIRDIDIFGLSGVTPVIYTSDTTVEIDNVDIDNNDGTPASGHIGIHIAGGRGDTTLRNVSVGSYDTGIYVASGNNGLFQSSSDIIIDDARIGNGRCGILLDASVDNIITNVMDDGTLTSGTVRLINNSTSNTISNIKGGSATAPTVVLSSGISGNIISNIMNPGEGPTIVSSGTNRIAAYYPRIGASIPPRVTVWESGSLGVNAIRNNDGVIIASGEFDAVMQTAVLEAAKSPDGTILIKGGAYSVSSGIAMSGDIRLMGEGHSTTLQCDLGCTSGVIKMREGFQEVSDLEIQTLSGHMLGIYMHTGLIYASINNVFLDGAGAASGTKGIFVNNDGPFNITNIKEIQNFGTGIYIDGASAAENYIDNVRFVGCDTGIRGARIKRNRINNIYGDIYESGLVILESGSTNNIVNNIIGRHTTLPVVVVQTSGINNVITNVTNASGGPSIVDFTSGVRNFLSPGALDPVVLISGDSPFTYLNASGRQEMVTVGGGTVNSIDFVRAGTTTNLSGLVAGSFILNGGDKLVINHSGMPTMNIIPTG